MENNLTKEDYNNEPVYYCASCLSLKIRGEIRGLEYCDKCGSTNIEQCHIDEWLLLFKERTGHEFLYKH